MAKERTGAFADGFKRLELSEIREADSKLQNACCWLMPDAVGKYLELDYQDWQGNQINQMEAFAYLNHLTAIVQGAPESRDILVAECLKAGSEHQYGGTNVVRVAELVGFFDPDLELIFTQIGDKKGNAKADYNIAGIRILRKLIEDPKLRELITSPESGQEVEVDFGNWASEKVDKLRRLVDPVSESYSRYYKGTIQKNWLSLLAETVACDEYPQDANFWKQAVGDAIELSQAEDPTRWAILNASPEILRDESLRDKLFAFLKQPIPHESVNLYHEDPNVVSNYLETRMRVLRRLATGERENAQVVLANVLSLNEQYLDALNTGRDATVIAERLGNYYALLEEHWNSLEADDKRALLDRDSIGLMVELDRREADREPSPRRKKQVALWKEIVSLSSEDTLDEVFQEEVAKGERGGLMRICRFIANYRPDYLRGRWTHIPRRLLNDEYIGQVKLSEWIVGLYGEGADGKRAFIDEATVLGMDIQPFLRHINDQWQYYREKAQEAWEKTFEEDKAGVEEIIRNAVDGDTESMGKLVKTLFDLAPEPYLPNQSIFENWLAGFAADILSSRNIPIKTKQNLERYIPPLVIGLSTADMNLVLGSLKRDEGLTVLELVYCERARAEDKLQDLLNLVSEGGIKADRGWAEAMKAVFNCSPREMAELDTDQIWQVFQVWFEKRCKIEPSALYDAEVDALLALRDKAIFRTYIEKLPKESKTGKLSQKAVKNLFEKAQEA